MPDFLAGTYPYAKRQAIADAVQAGLLPHTQQPEGDSTIRGAVTVLVRVTPPDTEGLVWEVAFKKLADSCFKHFGHLSGDYDHILADARKSIAPEVARGCATKVVEDA